MFYNIKHFDLYLGSQSTRRNKKYWITRRLLKNAVTLIEWPEINKKKN